MKYKKIATFFLITSMVISSSINIFSSDNNEQLQEAILSTKEIIHIPKEYENFSYSVQDDVWNLNWYDKNNEGSILVSIDNEGNIIQYSNYPSDNNSNKLSNFSRVEAEKTAKKFISSIDYLSSMDLRPYNYSTNYSRYDNSYTYYYQQYINDIPVSFNVVSISIDKYDNEVTNFSGLQPKYINIEVPKLNNIINYENGKKAYMDNLGFKLKYYSYYDYKNEHLNVFPAYNIYDNKKGINAFTGETVDLCKNEVELYKNSAAYDTEALSADGANLTEQEISEIENLSDLMSKKEAENKIKTLVSSIPKDTEIRTANLYKEKIGGEQYIWNLQFENGYASIEAKTKELISFYTYDNTNITNNINNISKEDANKTASDFINKVFPNYIQETRYDELNDEDSNESYNFKYIRQYDGIDFVNNYIEVKVNKNTNIVTQYSKKWYPNIKFPNINNAISIEDTFDHFNNISKFVLTYELSEDKKVIPVYMFEKNNSNAIIDYLTGKRLNYKGEEYKDDSTPKYNDISGHWCEDIILKLLDNGYYLNQNEFKPDEVISKADFLNFLYSNSYNKELKKDDNKPLTRYECSLIIADYLNYSQVATYSDIFINPYNDELDFKYKGAVAICYKLNIFKTEDSNNFNGEQKMTNAEAAYAIYNLILSK